MLIGFEFRELTSSNQFVVIGVYVEGKFKNKALCKVPDKFNLFLLHLLMNGIKNDITECVIYSSCKSYVKNSFSHFFFSIFLRHLYVDGW